MRLRQLFHCAVMLAALLVLAACGDTKTEVGGEQQPAMPSLTQPADIKAAVYEGMIIVSWNPVKDAKSYDVYRRDSATGQIVTLAKLDGATTFYSSDNPYYVDYVGFYNQLVHGRGYQYTVVAHSGQSTNGLYDNQTRVEDLVFNSQTSVNAAANIPNRDTYLLKGPNNIKVERMPLEDTLIVTWKAEINMSYDVAYTYAGDLGSGATGDYSVWRGSAHNGIDGAIGFAIFPLIGGANTVTVYPSFSGGHGYYPEKETFIVTEDFVKMELSAPGSFTSAYVDDVKSYVSLTWYDVYEATSYNIYKAEVSDVTTSVANVKTTTISDWTAVQTSTPEMRLSGGIKKWYAKEENFDPTKNYAYMIIAQNSTAKSIPATTGLAAKTYTPGNGTFTAPVVAASFSTAGSDVYINLSWAEVKDSNGVETTYEVYRAATAVAGGTAAIGDWAKLSLTIDKIGNTLYAQDMTDSAKYAYKVLAKGTTGNSVLSSAVAATPATISIVGLNAYYTGTGNAVRIQWRDITDPYGNTVTYIAYRAEQGGSQWTALAMSGLLKAYNSGTGYYDWYMTDSVDNVSKNYNYLIVAEAGSGGAVYRSAPATTVLSAQSLAGTSFALTVYEDNTTSPKIQITWNSDDNATYALYRAEVGFARTGMLPSTSATPVTESSYVQITLPAGYNNQGRAVVIDPDVTIRKMYRYKLVTMKNGLESTSYTNISNYSFSIFSDAVLSLSSTAGSVEGNPKAIAATVTLGSMYKLDQPVFDLYRRVYSTPQTSYVLVHTFDRYDNGTLVNKFVDTGLTETLTYQYKLVARLGSIVMDNDTTKSVETTGTSSQLPSFGGAATQISVPADANATTIRFALTGGNLTGETLEYRFAETGTTNYTSRPGTIKWDNATGAHYIDIDFMAAGNYTFEFNLAGATYYRYSTTAAVANISSAFVGSAPSGTADTTMRLIIAGTNLDGAALSYQYKDNTTADYSASATHTAVITSTGSGGFYADIVFAGTGTYDLRYKLPTRDGAGTGGYDYINALKVSTLTSVTSGSGAGTGMLRAVFTGTDILGERVDYELTASADAFANTVTGSAVVRHDASNSYYIDVNITPAGGQYNIQFKLYHRSFPTMTVRLMNQIP